MLSTDAHTRQAVCQLSCMDGVITSGSRKMEQLETSPIFFVPLWPFFNTFFCIFFLAFILPFFAFLSLLPM